MDEILLTDEMIFTIVDRCRHFFSPEQWSSMFMDFSKNDIFCMLFAFRRKQVNMTEIADYLNVPLNTITGIVGRLEKKEIAKRIRSTSDKRVVILELTAKGKEYIEKELSFLKDTIQRTAEQLTRDEIQTLFGIAEKIFNYLEHHEIAADEAGAKKKIVKKIVIE